MEPPINNEVNIFKDDGNDIRIAFDSLFTYHSKITASLGRSSTQAEKN